ncbi:MAG: PIG-L family deacetylase, partial [Chloroflexi bacterium]
MAKKKSTRRTPRTSSRSNSSNHQKFDRVLGVFAHPDDPEFGAGGSMAKLAKDGAEVTYVIVTDGSQGGEDPKQKDSELVAIRQREQRAAAKVLGIKKVEFLGYKDGHLASDLKLRRDIVRMIRKHKPELVITHIPGRVLDAPMGGSHPDHIAVGEATMAAVYPDSRNPRAFRSLLLDPVLDAWRLLRRHQQDAGSQAGGAQEAQEPGRQTGAGMGRRQVDPQAAPRHREEERLHVRGVVQADQGLAR